MALHVFMGASDGWSGNASWKRKGGFPGTPLHGRNDMKTSKKRFSRQKHAHKQRKKGLSCHHAPPLYIWTLQLPQPARSGPVPRMRHAQVRSGTIRCTQVLSETLCFNLDSTVLRATDTLHCFNGLQQPQRPHRPKEPEEPQRPQGWMFSFDSHPPTFREEPDFLTKLHNSLSQKAMFF